MSSRVLEAMLMSAWPRPSIDNLLRAVALADRDKAAAAWRDFEASADFDNLTWDEFRLISLAAKRLVDLAPDSPMRPRISGIERSIWSRNQLVIGEAGTGLRKMVDASVEMLIMKGAGRAASGDAVSRGRIVNDIDIVVHPADLERAFDILVEDNWTPAGSGSVISQRKRVSGVAGINFVRGEFGKIDLHRTPFRAPFDNQSEDVFIWQRSLPGKLGYASVRVPSPLDTIIIAIAHGSLDARKSSDWLADIAVSIDKGVDWDRFLEPASKRRLQPAAAVALSYVRERLERPVPIAIMERLARAAWRSPAQLVATVAVARPKSDRFGLFWLTRVVAKQSRLLRGRRKVAKSTKLVLASPFRRRGRMSESGELGFEHALSLQERTPGEQWTGAVDIEILADLPPATRRLEFEINTDQHQLLRLRAFVRNRGRRRAPLRFRAMLSVPANDSDPVLLAVPLRSFNDKAPSEMLDRYGPTPFRLLAVSVSRRPCADRGRGHDRKIGRSRRRIHEFATCVCRHSVEMRRHCRRG